MTSSAQQDHRAQFYFVLYGPVVPLWAAEEEVFSGPLGFALFLGERTMRRQRLEVSGLLRQNCSKMFET